MIPRDDVSDEDYMEGSWGLSTVECATVLNKISQETAELRMVLKLAAEVGLQAFPGRASVEFVRSLLGGAHRVP